MACLASFLVDNEITKLAHLKYADHPSGWNGTEGITADELEAVWGLKRFARVRSR